MFFLVPPLPTLHTPRPLPSPLSQPRFPRTYHSASPRAEIGGLPLRELNQLELEFLFALDFDLAVHPQHYALCAAQLPAAVARLAAAESSAARLATLPANGAAGCGAGGAGGEAVCSVAGPEPDREFAALARAAAIGIPIQRQSADPEPRPLPADAGSPTLLAAPAEIVDTACAASPGRACCSPAPRGPAAENLSL